MGFSTGVLSGIFSMIGWGLADFFAAQVSKKIGNLCALFWIQLTGLCLAFIYLFILRESLAFTSYDLLFSAFIGLLQTFAYLSFYKGLEIGKVSLVSPIGASWSLVTILLSLSLFGEKLSFYQSAGVALTIFGVILVSADIRKLLEERKLKIDSGVKFAFGAMIGWGISLAIIAPQIEKLGWFLPIILMRSFVIAWLLIYAKLIKRKLAFSPQRTLLSLIILAGILDISAFFTYSFGVQGELASIVAPISAAFPLVTVVLAKIFLKEKIVLNQKVGIGSVVLGLIFLSLTSGGS